MLLPNFQKLVLICFSDSGLICQKTIKKKPILKWKFEKSCYNFVECMHSSLLRTMIVFCDVMSLAQVRVETSLYEMCYYGDVPFH